MNKQRDALWKWVIIGNSGVGKTSILSRLCNDEFNNTFISTIGIDFKIKKMEFGGRNITIQIWDTAGQERFATITKSCYRGACGIILAYDITNLASFNDVSKWIKDIEIHSGDNVHRILVGNKSDVSEARAVSMEEGQSTADQYGIAFVEVSAKTGKNVEMAFVTLAQQILGLDSTTAVTSSTSKDGDKNDGGSTSTSCANPTTNNSGKTSSSLFGWISGSSSTPGNTCPSPSPATNTTANEKTVGMTRVEPSSEILNAHSSVVSKHNTKTSTSTNTPTLQNNPHQTELDANVDSDIIRLTTGFNSTSRHKTSTSNFNNNEIRLPDSDSPIVSNKPKSRCCT